MPNTVTVTVPATTANLGPGFDCIGAALSLYNTLQFSHLETASDETLKITVQGTEAAGVQTDESNLAYQAFVKVYQHLGQTPPPLQMEIHLGVPLARGLGSSATAIVGGLVGANALAGHPLSSQGKRVQGGKFAKFLGILRLYLFWQFLILSYQPQKLAEFYPQLIVAPMRFLTRPIWDYSFEV